MISPKLMGPTVLGANNPSKWGEKVMGPVILGANCPWGGKSVGRVICGANFPSKIRPKFAPDGANHPRAKLFCQNSVFKDPTWPS